MKIFFLMLSVYIIACASNIPKVQYKGNLSLTDSLSTIAVLDFEYNGQFLTKKIAKTAADILSEDLFVKNRINIIDRSMVNEYLDRYKSTKREKFSKTDFQNIGNELNATYLILGTIQSYGSIEEYHESHTNKINVTIRIISTATAEVVGIIKHSGKSKRTMDELIRKVIEEMAFYMI